MTLNTSPTFDWKTMRREWPMTVLLWVLVAMGIWYAVGKEQDAKLKALGAKADTARVAFDTSVTVVMQTRAKSREAGRKEREAQVALTARLALLEDSIAAYRAVAADGTATADTLRTALVQATDQLAIMHTIAVAYVVAVDSLKAAYAEERRATTVALDKAEAALTMQDSVIHELQRPVPRKRLLQSFAIGVGVGVLLVLAK